MAKLFLDTSFAIALASKRDQYHAKALDLSRRIRETDDQLITTIPVIFEIGNSLAKQSFRPAAVSLVSSLHSDPRVTVVSLDQDLYHRAFTLFTDRKDKNWGLTDCVSFVVMEDNSIQNAPTADNHFHQAGFTPMLS